MRATQHTHRGAILRRIAGAIGVVAIASGIAVTGGAAVVSATGPSLPLHNNTATETATTGTGICALEGLDTTQSYWHFVITTNNFAFESLTLNLGDGAVTYVAGSYFDNGHPDQAYILVPAGHSITDLQTTGSFADVTPDPSESKPAPLFNLSHTCTAAPIDVCANIEGNQSAPPEGTVQDGANCVTPPPPVDVCANIEGNQSAPPEGTVQDGENCVTPPPPVDVCSNIDGAQATVPAGMTATDGICTQTPPPPVDVCSNVDGAQATVPAGMTATDGICTQTPPPPVDVCNNVDGAQATVPEGSQSDGQGGCVTSQVSSDAPVVIDVCSNLDGVQTVVPAGATLVNGSCDQVASEAVPAAPAEVTLPVTGSNTASGIAIGFGMVLAGVVLSVLARRKAARTSV